MTDLLGLSIVAERVELRTVSEADVADIHAHFTPDITRYMQPKSATNIVETQQFVATAMGHARAGTDLQMVVLRKAGGEFLGCVGLHDLDRPDPETGVWIKQTAHGSGLGLEAVAALLDWAQRQLRFTHIRYPVDRRNTASRAIAEHLDGAIRREFRSVSAAGIELDQVEYWIAKR
jgi:RimJ/RimL family protein N-acetyltransferase